MSKSEPTASERIDARIASLGDWRGEALARMRKLIHAAVPGVTETWKWMGTPVWKCDGIVCTGESYKSAVKLTFAHGAALPDPKHLFNSSLDGKVRRAIDIHAGERVDATAFKALVKAAAAHNRQARAKPVRAAASAAPPKASAKPRTIAGYIEAAAPVAQPHLRGLYAILKSVAPQAEEAIKWGNPFFIEPRFVFAFSAHKAHLSFSPSAAALEKFRKELAGQQTTKHFLQLPYDRPLPEALIRKIASFQAKQVAARKDDGFWAPGDAKG